MDDDEIRQRLTDQTLAEQLQITDREIADRKALLQFTTEDAARLRECKPQILEHLDEAVDAFYRKLTEHPQVQLVIGDAETFRRLHASMRRYVVELFEGYYDRDYVDKRLRIGKVHMRIGVSPKLYISAINLLQNVLVPYMEANQDEDVGRDLRRARRAALHKLLMLDVQFVFDTYIASTVSEVEAAKSAVERYAEGLEEMVAERTRQLERLSRTDPLTGLANKRACMEHLARAIAAAQRSGAPLTLAFIDLNGFKRLNDTRGHVTGDEVLERLGQCLLAVARKSDIAGRLGGDEFCVIMPDTPAPSGESLCVRLLDLMERRNLRDVTLSIGLAQTGPDVYADPETLLHTADGSMYEAKARARDVGGHQINTAATLRKLGT